MGLGVSALLAHSTVIGDTVFMVTQLVNMVALAIILFLARRFRTRSAPRMPASFTYESEFR